LIDFKRIVMKYFYLIILGFFCSCSVNENNLEEYMWKYSDGLYLGDVFYFKNKMIKNDSIYQDNKPKYFIKTYIGYFGYPTEMIIKDVESAREGRYIGK